MGILHAAKLKLNEFIVIFWCKWSGASTPLRPWCISPCFRISPYFRRISGLSEFFLQFYLFPKTFLTFIRQNSFFLVIHHKFRIAALFSLFQYIPPLRENYSFPPYFYKFPLCFRQIQLLFTYFTCISPLLWPWCIYASPNARTGRPCIQHVHV